MKLGLVLSGGASKCIAHLGVLKALFETGVRPDIIAATSGGALFGSFVAAGKSPDEALEIIMQSRMLNIFTPSKVVKGLFSSEKIEKALRASLPVSTFEELQIPMIVAATDMLQGKVVSFESGDIFKPIIASSSYPAIFEPVEINNRQLLDGGILCNLPTALLRERCDRIIGVSVGKLYALNNIKTQRKYFFRALELAINQSDKAHQEGVDLLLEPPDLNEYDRFDISRGKEIFAKGYLYALKKCEDIKK
ncbi:MAG: patatin-like phospholipase family protein, partial [Flavobacteriales bacterium]